MSRGIATRHREVLSDGSVGQRRRGVAARERMERVRRARLARRRPPMRFVPPYDERGSGDRRMVYRVVPNKRMQPPSRLGSPSSVQYGAQRGDRARYVQSPRVVSVVLLSDQARTAVVMQDAQT